MTAERKRAYAATPINESYNAEIRQRLRIARLSKEMTQQDIGVVAAGTINNYETTDISTARFGDLLAIGNALGMSGRDFIAYLIGAEEPAFIRSEESKNLDELSIYLRGLPPEAQELCVRLVRTVAAAHHGIPPAEQAKVAQRRRPSRR